MNMTLVRRQGEAIGAFGELIDANGIHFCFTLEHTYAPSFRTKLPAGEYICERGIHELHDGIPFEAFEVMGVPGHTGILFHVGNRASDSEGCCLLGLQIENNMLEHSKMAFARFMAAHRNENSFILKVIDWGE